MHWQSFPRVVGPSFEFYSAFYFKKERKRMLSLLSSVLFILLFHVSESSKESFHEELFGSGQFSHDFDAQAHLSSSTEDLMTLFEAEKNLIKSLKSSNWKHALKNEYLQCVDFDENTESVEYVYHPINAFHLVQRIVKYLPRLKKLNSNLHFNASFELDENSVMEAASGLANLQEYTNYNISDFAKGQLFDHITGLSYVSNSPLTSQESLKIAKAAKLSMYHESHVHWCQVALQLAKDENQPKTQIQNIKKMIKHGKKAHDYFFHESTKNELTSGMNEVPYYPSASTKAMQDIWDKNRKLVNGEYGTLIPPGSTSFDGESPLAYQLRFYLRRRTQSLCRGDFERPARLEKDLKCVYVHHNDSYLKLGPFKLEHLHRDPQIAIFRELVQESEIEPLKGLTKGQMVSTPLQMGSSYQLFTNARTSKVKYINELNEPAAMTISKRISLATRFLMKTEQYASENFQVMNYGIGGRIVGHIDSKGDIEGRNITSEKDEYGGYRMTTFMLYLSTVIAGGHTVFPQAGIHVKPVKGDALFWFNLGSHFSYDSRIFHLGCPVTYGNKWIANKWIKILPQFKEYPCSIEKPYFAIEQ